MFETQCADAFTYFNLLAFYFESQSLEIVRILTIFINLHVTLQQTLLPQIDLCVVAEKFEFAKLCADLHFCEHLSRFCTISAQFLYTEEFFRGFRKCNFFYVSAKGRTFCRFLTHIDEFHVFAMTHIINTHFNIFDGAYKGGHIWYGFCIATQEFDTL